MSKTMLTGHRLTALMCALFLSSQSVIIMARETVLTASEPEHSLHTRDPQGVATVRCGSGGGRDSTTNKFLSGGGGGGGGGGSGNQCDIDAQDCPDGSKCTVENIWVSTPRCRPLVNNPDQVGDQCSELDNNDGDSCDIDGLCLDGVCRQMDIDGTACGIHELSHFYPSGVRLCEETCDPFLLGECDADSHCTRTDSSNDGIFTCYITGSLDLRSFGEGCTSTHQCQQGAICLQSDTTGYCQNGLTHCCVPLCGLTEEPSFCTKETTCQSLYGNSPPPGLEHVGACVFYF